MTSYGLGIDTGGTYTDTVIVDLETNEILCGNKALTTRHDLSEGIRDSILGLDRKLFEKISIVSLSSTLATNSVVENKGCRVGLICIGKKYLHYKDPECYSVIDGCFDMNGKETEKLNIEHATEILRGMKGKIDSLAVSGYVSVRNPSHEKRIAELANEILGVPTVCGYELTSRLGFEQRTTTAIMNARLIPTITELLTSVKAVLNDLGLDAPLMVVKGDGSLMKDIVAMKKPVETILSGPASSLIGAKALTGIENAMMIDIGGTTSDIGILKDGFPRIEPEGANLGGKRTRVMAADIATFGIGGDSRIIVNGRNLLISSVREIPLCIASCKWPEIKEIIISLKDKTDDSSEEKQNLEDIIQNTEFFTLAHYPEHEEVEDIDRDFLNLLKEHPMRLCDAGFVLDVPPHSIQAALLESRGYITRIGVTPTDLLHADGTYVKYDANSSVTAIGYLARKCNLEPKEFINVAKNIVIKKIASCAMEKVFLDESGNDSLDVSQEEIIKKTIYRDPTDYTLDFRLSFPLIGIGAPVRSWLPKVADLLHTELIIPEMFEIGNAIGAVTGYVLETVVITIRATCSDYVEEPECNVFTGSEIKTFCRPHEALEYAEKMAERIALEKSIESGCKNPVIDRSIDEKYVEVSSKKFFRGATVTAKATGKPDLR